MARAGVAAVIGFFILTAQGVAPAQTVPLPQPAPKARTAPSTAAKPATPSLADSIATEAGQHALVDRVSLYLSTIQTLVGNFVQVGPDGRKTEGKFYIAKPGRVRFEYEPPSPLEVIADGTSVVVRDRNLNTQDAFMLSQTPLRYLLADQIDLTRDTSLVGFSQDNSFISLTIEERQLLVGTHRMVMMFNAKDLQLRQWTITDPQGYETTVAVYNLDTTHKPDPGMFAITYEVRQ